MKPFVRPFPLPSPSSWGGAGPRARPHGEARHGARVAGARGALVRLSPPPQDRPSRINISGQVIDLPTKGIH